MWTEQQLDLLDRLSSLLMTRDEVCHPGGSGSARVRFTGARRRTATRLGARRSGREDESRPPTDRAATPGSSNGSFIFRLDGHAR
jgi:hypothetical protein